MTFQRIALVTTGGVISLLTLPAIGAERMVVGEYFTATW